MKEPGLIKRFFIILGWAWMLLVDTKDPSGALGWGIRQLRGIHYSQHKPKKSPVAWVYKKKASVPHPRPGKPRRIENNRSHFERKQR
jgi:hypothetical protein